MKLYKFICIKDVVSMDGKGILFVRGKTYIASISPFSGEYRFHDFEKDIIDKTYTYCRFRNRAMRKYFTPKYIKFGR